MNKVDKEKEIRRLVIEYNIRLATEDGKIIAKRPGSKAEEDLIKLLKQDIIAYLKNQEEEKRREEEARRLKEEKEKQDILNNNIQIELEFHDGEWYQGFIASGIPAQLLLGAGVAKRCGGLVIIKSEYRERLGQKFFWSDVENIIKNKKTQEQLFEEKKKEAQQLGKPVLIARWHENCNDKNLDCSIDTIEQYVSPDGKIEYKRIHNF